VPKLAPVAVGLNGSGIYIATALGAAAGGTALAIGGSAALPVTAAVIGRQERGTNAVLPNPVPSRSAA
jgi:MFS transporter, DHA1 family, inner membrane transport protein